MRYDIKLSKNHSEFVKNTQTDEWRTGNGWIADSIKKMKNGSFKNYIKICFENEKSQIQAGDYVEFYHKDLERVIAGDIVRHSYNERYNTHKFSIIDALEDNELLEGALINNESIQHTCITHIKKPTLSGETVNLFIGSWL